MRVSLVVAMDEGNLIGAQGRMPWHVPEELKHFRRLTLGHSIIMGRKTFESIGRVLDRRHNVVLSRDREWTHEGVITASSFDDALAAAGDAGAAGFDASEVFVIGGAQIYSMALARAQRVYLTRMHARFSGDAYFPVLAEDEWQVVASERHAPDGQREFDMSYLTLERRVRSTDRPAPLAAGSAR